jgi:hypothetical protein
MIGGAGATGLVQQAIDCRMVDQSNYTIDEDRWCWRCREGTFSPQGKKLLVTK